MTSQANRYPEQHIPPQATEEMAQFMQSMYDQAQERRREHLAVVMSHRRHEIQKRRMRDAFYGYAVQQGLDPREPRPHDEPALAKAIAAFSHAAVERRNAVLDASGTPLLVLNEQRVGKLIQEHYSQFGLRRDALTGRKLAAEDETIEAMKKKVYVTETRLEDSDTNGAESYVTLPRHVRYPEIGIVLQLRDALLDDGSKLAVDASEVTLAAYGSFFPPLSNQRTIVIQNREGITQRQYDAEWPTELGSRLVRRITEVDIPPDVQAEDYRPRPPRE